MRRTLTTLACLTLTGAAALCGGAASAVTANGGAGSAFSQHVRTCQEDMGFSGTHNPGVMHQGFSGWDSDHTC